MSERLAILRAIRANPDDDTARLVFADWLDERDDPLGAFVRIQLELEPIRHRIDNPRAMELHKCEDELLRAHGDEWIPTNGLLTNPSDFGPVFRRGLPDYACLSLDTFLKSGEALFAAYPTLREVALYGVANRCWELTMSPLLANLETLEIADWPTEDDAISLGVSPHLPRISRFKLWAGIEMPFLHELVKQANTNWPREIELVQAYGGGVSGVPAAVGWREYYREQANSMSAYANATIGRPITHVTRPFERSFPLDGQVQPLLRAGRLSDGKPAIAVGTFWNWLLIRLTEDGHVREVNTQGSPIRLPADFTRNAEALAALNLAFEEWVEDLRLELGVVWVREFTVGDLQVGLWPWPLSDRIANSSPTPTEDRYERDWHNRGGEARTWLECRNFVITWDGSEYQADWRGKIHSS